jgi:O-antigen/teichoic acid export membrane protein
MFGLVGRWTIALTAFVCLPFLITPESALALAFGPGYEQAASAVRVYAVGTLLMTLPGPVGVLLQTQGRMKELLKMQFISAIVALAITAWLSSKLGVLGAAYGYMSLNSINAVLGVFLIKNMINHLYDRSYLNFMFAVGVALVGGTVLAEIPDGQLVRLLVGLGGFCVTFCGLLIFFRPFNQLDETIIRRLTKLMLCAKGAWK